MAKRTTKKTKAISERMQEELIRIFERYCKELISEQAKLNKPLKKQRPVLLSKKTTYNTRNITK